MRNQTIVQMVQSKLGERGRELRSSQVTALAEVVEEILEQELSSLARRVAQMQAELEAKGLLSS